MAKNIRGGAAASIQVSVVVREEVMIEVMSRLPVKSLIRFKCLSKRWLYLIRQDKYFISLHFSQSISSQKLLITSYSYRHSSTFFTLDLLKRSIERMPNTPKGNAKEPMFVNGLLCFIDQYDLSVCIRNIFTREETPWMRPNITKQYFSTFGLGFDPVTQKHKVVYLCRKPENCNNLSDLVELNCEVLTVGENYWRTKEDVILLPKRVLHKRPFYSNGSLYWCVLRPPLRPAMFFIECIVVFDVGKEKFRVIKYPDMLKDSNNGFEDNNYIDVVSEVDGRSVLLDKWYCDTQNKVIKMWMIDDDKEKNSSNWIDEETIYLPLNGKECRYWSFASITGFVVITCESVLEDEEVDIREWRREIYLYDMKKKNVIEFSRLLSLSQLKEFFVYPYQPKLSVFRSSIYPVCATAEPLPPPPPPPLPIPPPDSNN